MKNKDCDCRTTFPSATADNGILDIKNRKSVPGTCCEDPFPDVIVKFEDQTENIDVSFEDQSEEINVTMADVGTTLVQNTTDVRKGETSFWNNQPGLTSEKNVLYIYTDYYRKENEETGEVSYAPGLKIGDGSAYLIDLPFITGITQDDIDNWNRKWRGYLDPGFNENLVFTTH